MAVGLTVSKDALDHTAGELAKTLNESFEQVRQLKSWLSQQQDADLEALGYGADDLPKLRGAFDDLDQLRQVYEGAASLADAKDFRAYARWVWGFGF